MNTESTFKLIVHIGTGKTGTSSIQHTLSRNSALLRRHGVAYLGLNLEGAPTIQHEWQTPDGWTRLNELVPAAAADQLLTTAKQAISELQEQGCHTAVWSNESMIAEPSVIIPVLRNLRAMGIQIHLVAYVRRHGEWARSAYMQWGIKHKGAPGRILPFTEWANRRRQNLKQILDLWVLEAWDDFSIRNYDTCGNVTQDFLKHYGLLFEGVSERKDNETPNAVAMALWAFYNNQVDAPILPNDIQQLMNNTGLSGRPIHKTLINELYPSLEELNKIEEEAGQDREYINNMLAQSGQPPMDVSPIKNKDYSADQSQINAALLLMLKSQNDEIQKLKRSIQRLKRVSKEKSQPK